MLSYPCNGSPAGEEKKPLTMVAPTHEKHEQRRMKKKIMYVNQVCQSTLMSKNVRYNLSSQRAQAGNGKSGHSFFARFSKRMSIRHGRNLLPPFEASCVATHA